MGFLVDHQKGELRANADHTSRRVAMTVLKRSNRFVMSPIVAFENLLQSCGTGRIPGDRGDTVRWVGPTPARQSVAPDADDLDIPCCADVAIARHDISAAPHFNGAPNT